MYEEKGSLIYLIIGKKIAQIDDQAMGIDMHDIEVPSSSGTQTMPSVPHPYLGKLTDKCSQDVELDNKGVAVKGSKSKHVDPGHIPMPPGVKFTKQPDNQGEVSSNTIQNVKVNDKEVAVIGSMVKTCSDPMNQETCSIFPAGIAVPLPIFIPGMDKDTFKRDGGAIFNVRNLIMTEPPEIPNDAIRTINNPKWSSQKATVGEEVTLSAELTNQHQGAGVYFTIWEQGADVENDQPVDRVGGTHYDGKVEAKWRYSMDEFEFESPRNDMGDFYKEKMDIDVSPELTKYLIQDYEDEYKNPFDKTAKFFFTVKSYKCEKVEAGIIEFGDDLNVVFSEAVGNNLKDVEYSVIGPDKEKIESKTSSDGKIDKKALIPGQHQIKFKYKEKDKGSN